MSNSIAVVHLIRGINGAGVLQRFLDSYNQRKAGLPHDLVFIFKHTESAIPEDQARLIRPYNASVIFARDDQMDLGAYRRAIDALTTYDRIVFLNSFSEILADDWLKILAGHLGEGVGIVGCSASYESMAGRFQDNPLKWLIHICHYVPFPNPHVRTNAFIIRRETALAVWPKQVKTKLAAHRVESGRRSLTRKVLRLGLKAMVAERDGRAWEMTRWQESAFRNNQSRLLVGDNKTRVYDDADEKTKQWLKNRAWGKT